MGQARTRSDKLEALLERLGALGGVAVAFSGGVDSTLLLDAAREALGDRVVALVARSPSFPPRELDAAVALARSLGVRYRVVDTSELSDPRVRANPPDRCYHCKRLLLGALVEVARQEGLEAIVEGSNADDLGDHRPGLRAVAELGVLSPLAEAGLAKEEIRALSRERGLPTADKPSAACLASRVPYGVEITAERLARIDRAEEALRRRGYAQVRARDHGDLVRLEVSPEEVPRLAAEDPAALAAEIREAAGFRYVAVDLEGYRTGSLNEALAEPERGEGGGGSG